VTTLRKSCDEGLVEDFAKGKCVPSKEELMRRDAMNRMNAMGTDVLSKMARSAYDLSGNDAFVAGLKSQNGSNSDTVQSKVDAAINPCFSDKNRTWTLGVLADAKAVIGVGLETGIAVDVSPQGRTGSQRPIFAYGGAEYSFQFGAGASVGVNYGCWRAENNAISGDYHGVQLDPIALGTVIIKKSPAMGPVGFSIGFYYNPHGGDFNPERDYLGFTLTPVFGKDIDLGVSYVRGTTGQVTGVFPPPLPGDKVFGSFYTFKDDPSRVNEFIMGGPNLVRVRGYKADGTPGRFHIYTRKMFAGTKNVFVAQTGDATYTIEDNGDLIWRSNDARKLVILLTPGSKPR
jgi:hypothetical protein